MLSTRIKYLATLLAVTANVTLAGDTVANRNHRTVIATVEDAGSVHHGRTTLVPFQSELPDDMEPTAEISQLPGFPVFMESNSSIRPRRGVALADLTGDGNLEIVASSTGTTGVVSFVYAWDHTGVLLPGFPVAISGMGQISPAVGDLDGDGHLEIVQSTRGATSGGRLYAIDRHGNVLPGFPISFNDGNLGGPTLFDLDGDSKLEIIVGQRDFPIGFLHVVNHDGSVWGGNWPVELNHVPTGTAAVGDVNDDGDVEIFFLSFESMYLLSIDGVPLPGWPRQIENANFSFQSAALADLDGDGTLEIVVGAHRDAAGTYVFRYDGSIFAGWPQLSDTWTFGAPTVTDLEGDGVLEVINGQAGINFPNLLPTFWAWDGGGNVKPGFPFFAPDIGGGAEGPYTVARVAEMGTLIFADSNLKTTADGLGFLWGVDAQGNELPGFPLRPRGFTHMNSAAIGDMNGDGTYELVVLSAQDVIVDVNAYSLEAFGPFEVTGCEWPTYHLRNSRDGRQEDCVITLSAEARRVRGTHTNDLTWDGATSAEIDVFRDGELSATVPNDGFHTDSTGNQGRATYVYQVCEAGTSDCSNETTVRFGGLPNR